MSKTIVALYDSRSDAEAAVRDLETEGFDRSVSEIVTHTGTADRHGGGFLSRLIGWNVPESDAHMYAEGVRRGGSLLKLSVDDEDVNRVIAVLERGNVVDIEHRGQTYRVSGWQGYDETAAAYDDSAASAERARYTPGAMGAGLGTDTGVGTGMGTGLGNAAGAFREANTADLTANTGRDVNVGTGREEVIPVTEEEISIGKRTIERGSVRVRSYVVETPVEEQVRLRDETVTVERRPVTRGTGDVPADAFRERTVEVTETDEEAVVRKRAQVKEEVVIRKDVEERAQTVSDTVRRTEVEIDDGRTDVARDDVTRDTVRRDVRRDDIDR